jgi:hypothetical protein
MKECARLSISPYSQESDGRRFQTAKDAMCVFSVYPAGVKGLFISAIALRFYSRVLRLLAALVMSGVTSDFCAT